MRLLPRTAALLTPLLFACGGSSDGSEADGPDGAKLYRVYACAQCHGEKGEGSKVGLGPALTDKREYWDATTLEAYLQDPKGYAAGVERLGQAQTSMPALPASLSAEERAALVAHALELMD